MMPTTPDPVTFPEISTLKVAPAVAVLDVAYILPDESTLNDVQLKVTEEL